MKTCKFLFCFVFFWWGRGQLTFFSIKLQIFAQYGFSATFVTEKDFASRNKLRTTVLFRHRNRSYNYWADLATKRERQLTTARANQTTGLTNGRDANCASEVEFSPFGALSRSQTTFPFCY